jgi:hypothetical protein
MQNTHMQTPAPECLRNFARCPLVLLTPIFLFAFAPLALAQPLTLVPPTNKFPKSDKAMKIYADRPEWKIEVPVRSDGDRVAPDSIRLTVPSPFAGGRTLANSLLPIQPQSSIYRFKYQDISAASRPAFPFQYLEVDWNMEGLPRGPNGSFITPHFDFHFYTKDKAYVEHRMDCVSTGKTCDAMKTGYDQMRNFLSLPPNTFVPANYFPDNDSSIAAMGIHNLDGKFQYDVANVNHNAVIIYGSFEGEVAFLEVALTLYAFQDAAESAKQGRKQTWPILQPKSYAYPWWPTEVSLEYVPKNNTYVFSFAGFEFHPVEPYRTVSSH